MDSMLKHTIEQTALLVKIVQCENEIREKLGLVYLEN
jgi:hypothetical protein